MRRIETELPGVFILEPTVHADARGFFFESYHQRKFADLGITTTFLQDNHSRSTKGTLRGLHYQVKQAQAKLCRVIHGEVLDIAVDLRAGSPHFGQWVAVSLSAENYRQIFIPAGFGHGFVVRSETAEFLYKCDAFYAPEYERGVAWNDPRLAINWELEGDPMLSEKDRRNPPLEALGPDDLPVYAASTVAVTGTPQEKE